MSLWPIMENVVFRDSPSGWGFVFHRCRVTSESAVTCLSICRPAAAVYSLTYSAYL